jgi:hypothetical protein
MKTGVKIGLVIVILGGGYFILYKIMQKKEEKRKKQFDYDCSKRGGTILESGRQCQENNFTNAGGWDRTSYGKTPKQSCANQRCNCQTASGGQAEVTCQGNYPDCHC